MKPILLFHLLTVCGLCAGDLKPGFYPIGKAETSAVFDIEKKADRVVMVDGDGNHDLGLGKVTDGTRYPVEFSFEEIRSFLEDEKHKDLVVVWLEKTVMMHGDEIVAARAAEILKRMKEVGYKRVVILGARGGGVNYVADTGLEKEPVEKDGGDKAASPTTTE